jgi:hypothetical protein
VFERLGMSEAVRAKTTVKPLGAQVAEAVGAFASGAPEKAKLAVAGVAP